MLAKATRSFRPSVASWVRTICSYSFFIEQFIVVSQIVTGHAYAKMLILNCMVTYTNAHSSPRKLAFLHSPFLKSYKYWYTETENNNLVSQVVLHFDKLNFFFSVNFFSEQSWTVPWLHCALQLNSGQSDFKCLVNNFHDPVKNWF